MMFQRTRAFHFFQHQLLIGLFLLAAQAQAILPPWSYDPGPDPQKDKTLIDINAEIANFPAISDALMGPKDQKFRPAYGPVLWRMRHVKDSVKILFIGQDATHIAEAAGRTATAGFGGRAQDLAAHFGVNENAAFINAYAFTIQGQYGGQKVPRVVAEGEEKTIQLKSFIDNGLWLMSHNPNSPIVTWRNRFIDYIIRNNRNSLKMVVLFGKAAKDAAGTFVNSAGGSVPTYTDENEAASVQIPETKLMYAGGNNEFPVPLNAKGRDLYSEVVGRRLDYSLQDEEKTRSPDQEAALESIEADPNSYLEKMIFTNAGKHHNGLVHPGQLGGFNLSKMTIKGKETISLKGLVLSDGQEISDDILVVELPHPTALSRMKTKEEASAAVKRSLKEVYEHIEAQRRRDEKEWRIEPDDGMESPFNDGTDYKYSRKDIGPEYYDFGAPRSRMVSVSSASRMPKNPHVILFGSAKGGKFDSKVIQAMTDAEPEVRPSAEEMYTARPRGRQSRYVFDSGPGAKLAELMKRNLDLKKIFEPKFDEDGNPLDFKSHGIDAYYVKTHPSHADFGHYRGTFKNPRVVVLADPQGNDDLITARALTGTRGQYLHGLMRDLGVDDKYLVIKTVPFGMDGASEEDWEHTLAATEDYRLALFSHILSAETLPDLILADGPVASRIVAGLVKGKKVSVVSTDRSENDLSEAARKISKLKKFKGVEASLIRADIPRSHLSYYARIWEGTSGDRILGSSGKDRGLMFAEVAPSWATEQALPLSEDEKGGVEKMLEVLKDGGFRLPEETVPDFLERMGRRSWLLNPHFVPQRGGDLLSDFRLVG